MEYYQNNMKEETKVSPAVNGLNIANTYSQTIMGKMRVHMS